MQACFQRSHAIVALCTFLLATPTVRASDPVIVGYNSGSDVSQHSYIDLDQKEMESYLKGTPNWDFAKNIYEHGGNSGGYAEIQLALPLQDCNSGHCNKGVTVTQAGSAATGTLKYTAAAGHSMIKVAYTSTCKEGGYTPNGNPITSGCFTVAGAMTMNGNSIGTPSANGVKNKYRTLQGFSTQAQAKMAMQETYQIYRAYYGEYDYANQYVLHALGGTGPFSGLGDDERIQGTKKGTAYMNVWMYVIHEIEDAIMDCENNCLNPGLQDCNADPVHAIDEAAAFFAGSLEGASPTGNPDTGKLFFRLGEKRCANFGTCTGSHGQAAANSEIIAHLQKAQVELVNGRCLNVVPLKKRIVELLSIPLIQGSLRYSWRVAEDPSSTEKARAEGAVFAAAILPRVAACNPDKAKLISDSMKIDAANPMGLGFTVVKEAFESTYECLGITCEDIGGLIVSATTLDEYKPKAAPCVTPGPEIQTIETTKDQIPGWTIAVIIVIGVALVFACATTALFFSQANKYKKMAVGVVPA